MVKSAIVPNLSANIFSLSINRLAHEHSFRAESILNHTYRLYKSKHKYPFTLYRRTTDTSIPTASSNQET